MVVRYVSSSTRLFTAAGRPVCGASLNVFRFCFGLLIFAESTRFFLHHWIDDYLLSRPILFKYPGFEWVSLWPGNWLYVHFGLMAVLALMVALGLFYRLAIILLTLCFGYVFLLDQALYLNQYYLLLTLAFLLCFMPAERGYSLDSVRRRQPLISSVPLWNIQALRLQMELMLIFAGLVKVNPDWLRGEPLSLWLMQRSDIPLIGSWLSTPGLGQAASLVVIALHLVGAPLLLWRKTRLAVFLLYLLFHISNSWLFHIGLFPWITLAGTLLFFDPDWPRQIWRGLENSHMPEFTQPVSKPFLFRVRSFTFLVLVIFFVLQVLVPMRGFLYPGRASWTGEGDWFAWRMKLDAKTCDSTFAVVDRKAGWRRDVDPKEILSKRQSELMTRNPDMILQFARYLERDAPEGADRDDFEVSARIFCSLNGREPQLLIDPDFDLTSADSSWRHYDWIEPLVVPLRAHW